MASRAGFVCTSPPARTHSLQQLRRPLPQAAQPSAVLAPASGCHPQAPAPAPPPSLGSRAAHVSSGPPPLAPTSCPPRPPPRPTRAAAVSDGGRPLPCSLATRFRPTDLPSPAASFNRSGLPSASLWWLTPLLCKLSNPLSLLTVPAVAHGRGCPPSTVVPPQDASAAQCQCHCYVDCTSHTS